MAATSRTSAVIATLCLLSCGVMGAMSCAENTGGGGLLLSDYPTPFESETIIVIPEDASAAMTEGAGQIARKLEQLTDNEPPTRNDTALAHEERTSSNLILVVASEVSSLLEQICSLTSVRRITEQYPGENKGILQILQNPWNADKALLIVAGSDEPGLRAAIEFLMNDDEIRKLDEEKAIMQFDNGDAVMIPVDMLNSVMEYIRQHHSDAADFIGEDISWSRTAHSALPGRTENVYDGDGWTVTVGRPIVPEVVYDVRAEHITEAIVWVGRIEDGSITETSYRSGR